MMRKKRKESKIEFIIENTEIREEWRLNKKELLGNKLKLKPKMLKLSLVRTVYSDIMVSLKAKRMLLSRTADCKLKSRMLKR